MIVEKKILFEQARDRWPNRVRVLPTDRAPFFEAEPCLVVVYEDIQAGCNPKGEWGRKDEWTGLANWAFHQALCTVARGSIDERYIDRDEVTFDMFDVQMRFNLTADCWAAERKAYDESPFRFQ